MQGIQQMFRQHAVDKQSSIDSWHSTSTNNSSSCNSSYTNGKVELVNELKPWNQGLLSRSPFSFNRIHNTKPQKCSSQIVFSISFTKSLSRRVPSQCQILRNKQQLRNAIALATASIPDGVVARRIPIRWWWAEVQMLVTTIHDVFSPRRQRERPATAWASNVSAVHHFRAIL